jgi:hypothetical protein
MSEFYRPEISDYIQPLEMEQDSEELNQWLGGVIEAGSMLTIKPNSYLRNGEKVAYPRPVFQFQDEDELRSKRLKELFGGSTSPTKDNSSAWQLSGNKLANLVIPVAPYTPSRRYMISNIELWQQMNKDEQLELAYQLQGHNRYDTDFQPSEYSQLVELVPFVAGVLDAKARLDIYPHNGYPEPQVRITTKNKPLLDSLEEKFGGYLFTEKAGTEKIKDGKSFVTSHDSHSLQFTNAKAREIVEFARPHMLLQPENADTILQS